MGAQRAGRKLHHEGRRAPQDVVLPAGRAPGATGQPRRNAVVHVRMPDAPLLEARTDADGLAVLAPPKPREDRSWARLDVAKA